MSNANDALGKALHHVGINIDRTTLGVVTRDLEKRGYAVTPTSTPQFHVQPAPSDGQVTRVMTQGGAGGEGRKGEINAESRTVTSKGGEGSTKGGAGRV